MSGIISKEDALSARRWQPPAMDATEGAVQATSPRQTAGGGPPTARQYEAVYTQAEAQGREEGRVAGLALGRQEGYAAGLAEGLEAGRAQAQAEREALQTLMQRLAQPIQALDAEAETALVSLALELARQVVLHEVRTQPEAAIGALRRALAAFPAQAGPPWLRLPPQDVDMLRQAAPDLEASGISLIADDTLQRGDVIIASGGAGQAATPDRRWRSRGRETLSELDLRLEERWRQVMARLFEEGLQ
ncbi:flagellar assembly protein FliH [mine drainage metagenome]|uniref:Flagellar assembly protein FliH n=1 Tax=mine drainage metagenome TaxID=410659 RepID=A0A1J5PGL5_9ZZZZ